MCWLCSHCKWTFKRDRAMIKNCRWPRVRRKEKHNLVLEQCLKWQKCSKLFMLNPVNTKLHMRVALAALYYFWWALRQVKGTTLKEVSSLHTQYPFSCLIQWNCSVNCLIFFFIMIWKYCIFLGTLENNGVWVEMNFFQTLVHSPAALAPLIVKHVFIWLKWVYKISSFARQRTKY